MAAQATMQPLLHSVASTSKSGNLLKLSRQALKMRYRVKEPNIDSSGSNDSGRIILQ